MGLQIELIVALDRYEAHLRPPDCLRNCFGINLMALVRFYIRLDVLRRHQPYFVTLLSQSSPEKVRPSAGFHANLDLQVPSEDQSEMALFLECMRKCCRKGLDTADIVREAVFHRIPDEVPGIHVALITEGRLDIRRLQFT